jgi:hypothetical protein
MISVGKRKSCTNFDGSKSQKQSQRAAQHDIHPKTQYLSLSHQTSASKPQAFVKWKLI